MLTIDGRDPAWTNRTMSELWAHATKLNLEPLRWQLGFFNLRDVLRARDPHLAGRQYQNVRVDTVWGCEIVVVSLYDVVQLIAHDKGKPMGSAFVTLVPRTN